MTERAADEARVTAAARALAGSRWRLLRHPPAAGGWNMAVDEVLLEGVGAGAAPPTLRLYGWNPPALSLGRFQRAGPGLNLDLCRRRGWDVVRRPTGGRAVLHDRELTFALVVPLAFVANVGVLPSYCLFARAVNAGLARLGLSAAAAGPAAACAPLSPRWETGVGGVRAASQGPPASCFAASLAPDTLVDGRKLVGAAQVRRGGALLQHGSILLDVDRAAWAELFGEVGGIVTLAELVPQLPARTELMDRLAAGIAAALGISLEPGALTPAEAARAGRPSATRSAAPHAPLDSA